MIKQINYDRNLSPEEKLESLISQLGGFPSQKNLEEYSYFDRRFSEWLKENPGIIHERRTLESRKRLATSRFTLFEKAGSGCWGDVYRARDNATAEEVAVKVLNPTELAQKQMKERNLSPFEAMRNEAGMAACSHVVPRSFEIDEEGKPFIAMPYYDRFLSDIVRNQGVSPKDPDFKKTLGYMSDIAEGLYEMHRIRKRVHGDLKPDNIAIDSSGNLLLSDLGTSTCAGFGWSISPRDNMGCIYTRAPECFKPKSHPKEQSDNYAWACISYKLLTGKYPLEEEINNSKDPGKFFEQIGPEGFDKIVQKKVRKNIPKKLQEIIGSNLRYDYYYRYLDGQVLSRGLEETIENMDTWKNICGHARTALMYVALPAAFFSLAAYNIETHEPLDLKMPPTRIHGVLYPREKPEDQIEFESEQINDLPTAADGIIFNGGTKLAKTCTDNRNVAYLVKSQSQAQRFLGGLTAQPYTDNQFHDYMAWKSATGNQGPGSDPFPGAPWSIWAKSIEYSLGLAKHDGKVDLEDVCAISRVGVEKVDEAKRISKSLEYSAYRDAKYSSGEYVIPRAERKFIDAWLSYFHAEID